ncbi:PdaC/SigV domain-containing protein [Maribacter sp. X9]|uniref:DUF3298 and DUF4163 domain-containing protein n=1 Tax=Maribacter sp. X9 TaxID=3402159 RepID=UPI003AF3B5AA
MKIRLIYLLVLFVFFSCKKEDALTFEPYSISSESCEACSTVSISIPKALEKTKLSETINIALREEIIALLNFDEESDAQDIEGAVKAFIKDYQILNEKFPEESIPWEAKIKGTITFENKEILTIKLESYLFTGGAHGYDTVRFLNFKKVEGTELENQKLFINEEGFKAFAEAEFRKQEKIAAEAPINSSGFMFENEVFYLPENLGYTDKGVLLFYESYEIASYADGPITLTLPFQKVNPFLKFPIKP